MSSITQSAAWKALAAHRQAFDVAELKSLVAADAKRVDAFSLSLPGLHADYSRHLVTPETLALLLKLAETAGLAAKRKQLFEGGHVNNTEDRAALHTLLRAAPADVPPGLKAQAAEVREVFARLETFVAAAHAPGRFTDVVSIGIGGSHLGPEMVVQALTPLKGPRLRTHFVSNVDPMHVARVLGPLDPAKTLVIVISKTFTTQETLANAQAARAWLVKSLGESAVAQHFAAVSAAPDKAREFGIPAERVFAFWDWVGGRYSLWSAVGLPIALAHGFETFEALLAGAAQMDRHFRDAPSEHNLPVLLALLGIWYCNFWQADTRAVIPYRQDLHLLVPFLQQLEMESDGKRVRRDGSAVDHATAPVIWGDVGTNGQHAFFQLLHQGTELVPVDFIAVLEEESSNWRQQAMLLANCYAQAEALFQGRDQAQAQKRSNAALAPHKTFPGGRPSTLLTLSRLDAGTLGMLIALYEHRTFVQACVWDINPFDQMGVELGKQSAEGVLRALESGDFTTIADAATRAAVKRSRYE
ncbi:MAG TPA: glucose-6-phosphate isomerase [Gammaproteobacteria bacterium]|jgi:glucose-6-phosphate isomerase|nr:glucose-6-phosphate isomerase [Gammaproteobacteria bacterium]